MDDAETFGLILLVVGLAGAGAVLSNRVSGVVRVPAPALFLVGAAVVSDLVPRLGELSIITVERIVTVALAVILLDGGMHIGRRRFRAVAGPVVWLGVAGTLVTAVSLAAVAHLAFGLDWLPALLVGTALAPTDPAVVFSVLGQREVSGRAGTLLEGESGANDPVGIALMAALLSAAGGGAGAFGHGVLVFTLQMVVGAAVGLLGGMGLLAAMRRLPLPSEGLYPLRVLVLALVIYGVAAVAHGSGFLAVFIAGIVIGDEGAPYKREITRFFGALASLAEIVAFIVLGLTVNLATLPDDNAWLVGLAMAAILAFVVRPVLVGLVLLPVRLTRGERGFVLVGRAQGRGADLAGHVHTRCRRHRRQGRTVRRDLRRGRSSRSWCRAAWCPGSPAAAACRCTRRRWNRGRWAFGCATSRRGPAVSGFARVARGRDQRRGACSRARPVDRAGRPGRRAATNPRRHRAARRRRGDRAGPERGLGSGRTVRRVAGPARRRAGMIPATTCEEAPR